MNTSDETIWRAVFRLLAWSFLPLCAGLVIAVAYRVGIADLRTLAYWAVTAAIGLFIAPALALIAVLLRRERRMN